MITQDHWKEIANDYQASVGAMEALNTLEIKYASLEHANVLLANEKRGLETALVETSELAKKSKELLAANVALTKRIEAMQATIDEKQRKIEYQDGHLRTLRQAMSNHG